MPTQVVYFDEVRKSKTCNGLKIGELGYSCGSFLNSKSILASNYDRTRNGLKMRFTCFKKYLVDNGLEHLPKEQEVNDFIDNVQEFAFTSEHSVTDGTDTRSLSRFQIIRLGISGETLNTNKNALVRLINFKGSNSEFCAKPMP